MKIDRSMWFKEFTSQDGLFKFRISPYRIIINKSAARYVDDDSIIIHFTLDIDKIINDIINSTDNEMFVSSDGETLHIRDIMNYLLPKPNDVIAPVWIFSDESIEQICFTGNKGHKITFHRNYVEIETVRQRKTAYTINIDTKEIICHYIDKENNIENMRYSTIREHCQSMFGEIDDIGLRCILLHWLLTQCADSDQYTGERFQMETWFCTDGVIMIRKTSHDLKVIYTDNALDSLETIAHFAMKYIL